jgi:signal peptidase I
MKCLNCGLANLDHVVRCVKCGRELDLSASPAGIKNLQTYPPRANRAVKFLSNMLYSARRSLARFPETGAVKEINEPESPSLAMILMAMRPAFFGIVPGLGHWVAGRHIRALIILSLYLFFLFFGIFFYGRVASNIFFGFMILTHAVSIFDNFNIDIEVGFWFRFELMFVVYVVVMLGYYYAYQGITSRIYGFWLRDDYGAPLIRAGDFILVRAEASYSRGEIVVFRKERGTIRSYGEGQEGLLVAAGQYFDRIIGCPGDKIVLKDKLFTVNGTPLPENMYPLNKNHIFPDMETTLGDKQYFILPSAFRGGNNIPVDFFANYCKVNADYIDSSFYMIYAPWGRMRFLNN